jgi:hypothetical protein
MYRWTRDATADALKETVLKRVSGRERMIAMALVAALTATATHRPTTTVSLHARYPTDIRKASVQRKPDETLPEICRWAATVRSAAGRSARAQRRW